MFTYNKHYVYICMHDVCVCVCVCVRAHACMHTCNRHTEKAYHDWLVITSFIKTEPVGGTITIIENTSEDFCRLP